jgi:hypothetical protein
LGFIDDWKLEPSDRPDFLLNDIIKKCETKVQLEEQFKSLLENNGPITSSWKFTVTILNALCRLKVAVEDAERTQPEEQRSIEVLSLQAQFDVQKCVELVVGFGIVPYLLPGIGVPEKLRKKNYLASELFLGDDRRLPHLVQFHRLAQVTEVVLDLVSNPSFNSLIVPKHASDVLGSLLQICKSPLAKPDMGEFASSGTSRPPRDGALTLIEYNYIVNIRERLEILMNNFLRALPKSMLVNSLFIIGATKKPKWVRNVCNELVAEQVLLSPNGLILISSTLLSESSASDVWQLARVISNLMRDALTWCKNKSGDGEEDIFVEKMKDMCVQCVKMIVCTYPEHSVYCNVLNPSSNTCSSASVFDSNENNANANPSCNNDILNFANPCSSKREVDPSFAISLELSRIGLFCSIVLMDINCHIVRQLVWNPLFEPLLQLQNMGPSQTKSINRACKAADKNLDYIGVSEDNDNEHKDTSNAFSLDTEKIMICCGVAECLLSLVIPTGVSLPLESFQPVWSLFFQVFVACVSYLEKKVQEQSVAQLAHTLRNKLQNILISLLEVFSSGFGDKLDLASQPDHKASSYATQNNSYNQKIKTCSQSQNTVMKPLPEERAKTFCEFCINLILNENEVGDVGLYKLELRTASSSQEMGSECVKIVRIGGNELTGFASGCQNETDQDDGRNNIFELLSDECTVLCSEILRHERVASITSQLFCQLLSYGNERTEGVRNENSPRRKEKVLPSSSSTFEIKSSHTEEETRSNSIRSSSCIKETPCTKIRDCGFSSCTSEEGSGRSSRSKELTQLEFEGNHLLPDEQAPSFRKFVALKLLSDLGGDEAVVEECVKTEDYKEAFKLVEVIMKKLTSELECSTSSGQDYEFIQSISFALGILGTVVETAAVVPPAPDGQSTSSGYSHKSPGHKPKVNRNSNITSYEDSDDEVEDELEKGTAALKDGTEFWNELKIFIPHLQILEESKHPGLRSAGIPVMASNIKVSIETQGCGVRNRVRAVKKTEYEKALEDTENPMLPIKGHGLLQLRRLIEKRDPETLKNEKKLVHIFEAELINEDSYVYLMAIQGLAAVGLKFHSLVIPLLIQEYDFINPAESDSNGSRRDNMYRAMTKDERTECRMKIGEVLVRIVQKLGQIAPVYRVPLTNLFFRVLRDDDPLIRASALSNLAELCHLLKFSLGVVLTEVS